MINDWDQKPYYPNPDVEKCMATYIWLGGSGNDIRAKTKILPSAPKSVEDLPKWNYDGSSTNQADTMSSEIDLVPRFMCRDPFRRGTAVLVLCDTYNPDGTPATANFRHLAEKVFNSEKVKAQDTWFGIEQEYIVYKVESANFKYPIGFGRNGFNAPQGMYYCGIGAGFVYGRSIAEDHMRCCLYAGLEMSGLNAEVFPGQWEYQVGVCKGIGIGDQLWMSRYILQRVCEEKGLFAEFEPKPVKGDWNGSGCHTNYSTNNTRDPSTGWDSLLKYCDYLKDHHKSSMELYGTGNEMRMTGLHETAKFDEFSLGIGARGCSVRIGNDAKKNGCGYMEDRRPSSNIDPYLSCAALADITTNDGVHIPELLKAHREFVAKKP